MTMREVAWPLARDSRGGAILEFAVLAPVLLTLILGGVDVGRMFYVRQSLEYATEQAARYYMIGSLRRHDQLQFQSQRDLHDDHGDLLLCFCRGISRARHQDPAREGTSGPILICTAIPVRTETYRQILGGFLQ
jgi:hypothetical protein